MGRVFLLIAYPVQMTTFPAPNAVALDGFSGATPLAALKANPGMLDLDPSLFVESELLGSLGEVAALPLLLGFAYMLYRKVITWHIPVAVLGSMFIFAWVVALFGGASAAVMFELPLFHILAGGAILGAVYMATDYATSPMTPKGMLIYGVGIGVITMCIRLWGAYPEGMSFAILIMNAVTPLLNKYVKPKRFGLKK